MFGLGSAPLNTNSLASIQPGDITSAALIVPCSCISAVLPVHCISLGLIALQVSWGSRRISCHSCLVAKGQMHHKMSHVDEAEQQ